MRSGILCQELANGLIVDFRHQPFPSAVSGLCADRTTVSANDTAFGYVHEGVVRVKLVAGNAFTIPHGFFFSVPGVAELSCEEGRALVVTRAEYQGMFTAGGPLEPRGRLRYINGCSDSVLIAPPRRGDPCLNMLYVPPGIDQTAHTHPTVRAGMVVSGSGICRTPEHEIELFDGGVFVLAPHALHSFHTIRDHLKIVVFHPDSDTGPDDDDHPMVNRTLVDGESVSKLAAIRTAEV